MASSGGRHRLEKYVAMLLGFLELAEKTRLIVRRVSEDGNGARFLLTNEYEVQYQEMNLSLAC